MYKSNSELLEICLSGVFKKTGETSKTTAKFWKDLKVGDSFEIIYKMDGNHRNVASYILYNMQTDETIELNRNSVGAILDKHEFSKNGTQISSFDLEGEYKVENILKKTTANFFKHLNVGDVIKLSHNLGTKEYYSPLVCISTGERTIRDNARPMMKTMERFAFSKVK